MEDWKKKIEDSASNMKVPDSLQPDRMEERLRSQKKIRPFYRKQEFAAMTAAAVILLLVGGAWIFQNNTNGNMTGSSQADMAIKESAAETADRGVEEAADDEVAEVTAEVPQESFDDYYHTTTYEELEKQITTIWKKRQKEYEAMENGDTAEAAEESAGTGAYSTTNLQVEGVDEGDLVKTDGTYIYLLSAGSWLRIVKADNMELVAEISSEEIGNNVTCQEMYVENGLLILAADQYENNLKESAEDVYYVEGSNKTILITYDISDASNPRLLGRVSQDGCYRTSRKVGDYVYLFSDYYCTVDENDDSDTLIPRVNGSRISEDEIYVPNEINDSRYLVMSSINMKNPGNIKDEKALINSGEQFHITESSIYVVRYDWNYEKNGDQVYTNFIRFSMRNGDIQAKAAVSLKGELTDTFAVNEYSDYLRVLLTDWSGTAEDGPVNRVYVLDKDMEICGQIDHLAQGETIYSARFMGDKGYFVTYRNTDPLFSVDFSDPENPRILGELKVTGFSEYLHFYGEGKLLGLGWETDPNSGEILGLKISMYDISDPENVAEENKLILKNVDGCDGLYKYKAVLADADENLIGFTIESYDEQYCKKYVVFSYQEDEGFVKKLEYNLYSEVEYGSSGDTRGLYIDDVLYVVEEQRITAFDRKNAFEKLGALELD